MTGNKFGQSCFHFLNGTVTRWVFHWSYDNISHTTPSHSIMGPVCSLHVLYIDCIVSMVTIVMLQMCGHDCVLLQIPCIHSNLKRKNDNICWKLWYYIYTWMLIGVNSIQFDPRIYKYGYKYGCIQVKQSWNKVILSDADTLCCLCHVWCTLYYVQCWDKYQCKRCSI